MAQSYRNQGCRSCESYGPWWSRSKRLSTPSLLPKHCWKYIYFPSSTTMRESKDLLLHQIQAETILMMIWIEKNVFLPSPILVDPPLIVAQRMVMVQTTHLMLRKQCQMLRPRTPSLRMLLALTTWHQEETQPRSPKLYRFLHQRTRNYASFITYAFFSMAFCLQKGQLIHFKF